jgi:hypothetical protein
MFSPQEDEEEVEAPRDSHPFSNELAQLDEAVEDITHTVRDAEDEDDAVVMKTWGLDGLAKFDAADYLVEIHAFVDEALQIDQPIWI